MVPSAPVRINWLIFFVVLFAPLVLTILSVRVASHTSDFAPVVALIGGGVSAIICGILLGRRVGATLAAKVALSVLFVVIMGVVCIGMNCFGCLAGGYNLNLH